MITACSLSFFSRDIMVLRKLAQITPNSSSSYPNPSIFVLSEASRIAITSSSYNIGKQNDVEQVYCIY